MLRSERFIFLDIDGVLNSENTRYVPPYGYGSATWDGIDFNCICRLNKIVEETNAKLILSSSWKHYKPLEYCEKHLQKYGLKFPILTSEDAKQAVEILKIDWVR